MALKRTMVHVEEEDMALIKAAAARSGVPEAQIIREGVHLAALRSRRWESPMEIPEFDSGDPAFADRVDELLDDEFGTPWTGAE